MRILLSLISFPFFSRVWGHIAKIKHPKFLAKKMIYFYQTHYNINMDEYIGNLEDYTSLFNFFIRYLNPKTRPLSPKNNAIVSPADGTLINIEKIYEDKATQVKDKLYSITELVKEKVDFSKGWFVATIYLSPSDYHRFHYPLSGDLKAYCHSTGSLFPVNSKGMNLVNKLFIRNERIISKFEKQGLPFYMVSVGATNVGSIKMEFISKIKRDNKWKQVKKRVTQLDEMGRFEMGSTIILLCPNELVEPPKKTNNQKILVGEPIFSLKSP